MITKYKRTIIGAKKIVTAIRRKFPNTSTLIAERCDAASVPEKYKVLFGKEIDVYTPFHEYFWTNISVVIFLL